MTQWDACFSVKNFEHSIFREHVEEASALFQQRMSALDDPEIPWSDVEYYESALDPHIDALVVGEETAQAVCEKQAEEGGCGEVYTMCRVYCRQGLHDRVLALMDRIAGENLGAWAAIADALEEDDSGDWGERLAGFTFLPYRWVAARLRLNAAPSIARKLFDELPILSPSAVSLASSLQQPTAGGVKQVWTRYLAEDSPLVRCIATIALLETGARDTFLKCAKEAASADWCRIPAALSGGSSVNTLLAHTTPNALLAMGLHGDPENVAFLLANLSEKGLAATAAVALNLILGADLIESAMVLDEPFDDEEEASFRRVKRLSQRPSDWESWWNAHRDEFQHKQRYRMGRLCTPTSIVTSLEAAMPRRVRWLIYEELVIRYGLTERFSTGMLVQEQRRRLQQMRAWSEHVNGLFEPGAFYFRGSRVEVSHE